MQSSDTTADASYTYILKADSGYKSTMKGRITVAQHRAITTILGATADEEIAVMLDALNAHRAKREEGV